MQYNTLFGPVPSRRLGISLGVDLVPMKTCTLNCIYCECGKTSHLTLERKEYVSFEAVKKELTHYLAHHARPDYITFSGSGEPTLNSKIGDVICFLKDRVPDVPVAVLTNSTLFSQKQVRSDIKNALVVIPSLDAATEKIFNKINRPSPHLHVDKIIDGLIRFRKEYNGKIWLEVFIIPGMNDTITELNALKLVIGKIKPDQVHLNTLDRPGSVSTLRAATREELEHVLDVFQMENAAIVADPPEHKALFAYRKDTAAAILGTIARRPCTSKDLSEILGLQVKEVDTYLKSLEADEKIKVIKQKRGLFYQLSKKYL
ncbi:MAG: radical SAM protein [Desulfobacteraceae bacterium]|nr:radical SAM protein [Desulfobacteraceae bacterium]